MLCLHNNSGLRLYFVGCLVAGVGCYLCCSFISTIWQPLCSRVDYALLLIVVGAWRVHLVVFEFLMNFFFLARTSRRVLVLVAARVEKGAFLSGRCTLADALPEYLPVPGMHAAWRHGVMTKGFLRSRVLAFSRSFSGWDGCWLLAAGWNDATESQRPTTDDGATAGGTALQKCCR